MDKSKTKNYKSYDSTVLEALFLKYKVSKYYIRQCINGTVQGIKPDNIKKDYLAMEKANKDAVFNLIKKTL
ncbi:hypothetical protein [Flavobacterium phragmitis]|uniref:Uncharacterized protein n=1 Tax=Flavobacterium phragmitis TaxID=739143 RepID=A0A1I1RRQ9_9FLAO|nr:hypothetical protein [Flavobacterium phragmitis]SFD37034.1 hypothetical protein SAMN05216297_107128 [Flavobacterium phragmitis]